MSTAAQDVFSEHLGVISALRDNYQRTEDAVAVAGVVRAQQEVAAACSAREKQVKETIKGASGMHGGVGRTWPCRSWAQLGALAPAIFAPCAAWML